MPPQATSLGCLANCHNTILAGAIFDCDMLHFKEKFITTEQQLPSTAIVLPDKQLLFKDINSPCPYRQQLLLKHKNDWISIRITRTTAALCI